MKWQNVLFLILLLESCSKPETKYYYLTDFEKSVACFQKGSYWIYQNDSTLVTDSVYVNFFIRDMDNAPGNGGILSSTEYCYCTAKSTLYPNLGFGYNVRPGGGDVGGGTSKTWRIFYSINADKIIGNHTYPTYTLNGLIYSNATQIIDSFDQVSSYYYKYVVDGYVVPNAGLIKRDIQYKDSIRESWSLIRYNIIR